MKYDVFPIRKELEAIQHQIPEINPAAVMAMLRITCRLPRLSGTRSLSSWNRNTSYPKASSRDDDGAVRTSGRRSSFRAGENAGVSRATISVMLHRMLRDKLII